MRWFRQKGDSSAHVRQSGKFGSNKKRRLFLGTLIVLMMFVVGALFFVAFVNSRPEKLLVDAIGSITSELIGTEPSSLNGVLATSNKKAEQEKTDVSFSFLSESGVLLPVKNKAVTTDFSILTGGKTLRASGEVIYSADGTIYLKINKPTELINSVAALNAQPYTTDGATLLSQVTTQLDGKWIQITQSDRKEFGFNEVKDSSKCTDALRALSLSESDKRSIKKLYGESPFLEIAEKPQTESISGKNSMHFKLNINKEKWLAFAEKLSKISSVSSIRSCSFVSAPPRDLNKFDLWVDMRTHKPTQFIVSTEKGEVTTRLTGNFNKTSNTSAIIIPTETISSSQLKKDLERVAGTSIDFSSAISALNGL